MVDLPVSIAVARALSDLQISGGAPSSGAYRRQEQPILGLSLECASLTCGVIGKQLLRLGHLKQRPFLRVIGFVLQSAFGPALDAWALATAAQSLLVLLGGAFDCVGTLLLAPWFLGEHLTSRKVAGAALVAVGTIIAAGVGPHGTSGERGHAACCNLRELPGLLLRPAVLIWAVMFAVVVIVGIRELGRGRQYGVKSARRGLAFGTLGGIFAGNSWCLSVCLRLLAEEEVSAIFASPLAWLAIVGAAMSALFAAWLLVRGTAEFETVFLVPIVDGARIVSGAASGLLVLNEAQGLPSSRLAGYLCAVLGVLAGILALYLDEAGQSRCLTEIGQELASQDGAATAQDPQRASSYSSRQWGEGRWSLGKTRDVMGHDGYRRGSDSSCADSSRTKSIGLALFGSAGENSGTSSVRRAGSPETELLSFHSFTPGAVIRGRASETSSQDAADSVKPTGPEVAHGESSARPVRPM